MGSKFFFLHPHPYSVRSFQSLEDEILLAEKLLGAENVSTDLTAAEPGRIIIPRYRMLPFGRELELEASRRKLSLINSYQQHRMIADQQEWWRKLHEENLTPVRYVMDDYMSIPEGEYFVKGETNSLKNDWFDACYAPNKKSLIDVVRRNMNDGYISNQQIFIQPFQRYRKIAEAVNGRPVFNERRAFIYKGEVLSHAPYWTGFDEAVNVEPLISNAFENTLQKAVALTKGLANFYVIDLAEHEDGHWMVVELNDATMSGLSYNTPEDVFGRLLS